MRDMRRLEYSGHMSSERSGQIVASGGNVGRLGGLGVRRLYGLRRFDAFGLRLIAAYDDEQSVVDYAAQKHAELRLELHTAVARPARVAEIFSAGERFRTDSRGAV